MCEAERKKAEEKFTEMVGNDSEEEDDEEDEIKVKIEKPIKPIFAMTTDEVMCYFGILLKSLYKEEGVLKYKLWSTVKNGVVIKKATELKCYDKKCEEILPRDDFVGRGSGGANIGNKLKLVCSYLLDQFGIDHNTFAVNIPPNFKSVEIDFNNYSEFIEKENAKKRSKVKALGARQKSRLVSVSDNKDNPQVAPPKGRRRSRLVSVSDDDDDAEVVPPKAKKGKTSETDGSSLLKPPLNRSQQKTGNKPL